jgi:hypothetical protein
VQRTPALRPLAAPLLAVPSLLGAVPFGPAASPATPVFSSPSSSSIGSLSPTALLFSSPLSSSLGQFPASRSSFVARSGGVQLAEGQFRPRAVGDTLLSPLHADSLSPRLRESAAGPTQRSYEQSENPNLSPSSSALLSSREVRTTLLLVSSAYALKTAASSSQWDVVAQALYVVCLGCISVLLLARACGARIRRSWRVRPSLAVYGSALLVSILTALAARDLVTLATQRSMHEGAAGGAASALQRAIHVVVEWLRQAPALLLFAIRLAATWARMHYEALLLLMAAIAIGAHTVRAAPIEAAPRRSARR